MKNFLSVLYRRILYKIPLKWLLIALAIFGLMFACTKADNLDYIERAPNNSSANYSSFSTDITISAPGLSDECIYVDSSSYYGSYVISINGNSVSLNIDNGHAYCFYNSSSSNSDFNVKCSAGCRVHFYNYAVYNNTYSYTSQKCQTEYNLIPINEVDNAYCESNNLCPSGGSPSDCPNVGVSNIWINDLFHPGAFNIIMNIPEEIDWDYAYTNSGQNMNIDVVGYNVDYDYINDVVDTQNYKPTSNDLSSIVSSIIPLFVPGLCIILLLYFIFRFIKKIF